MNERAIVLQILSAVLEEGAYSHLLLQAVLDKYAYLDRRQRAFISRLSEGVIERRISLDYILDHYSRTPVQKMKPMIRNSLRMGLYQILYMDAVPDSAACNESVKLIAKRYRPLKGFVNGLLRNIVRHRQEALDLLESAPPGIRYSMPSWLFAQWSERFGRERCEDICKSFLAPKRTCIRVNVARISVGDLIERLEDEGVTVERARELNYALYISGYDSLQSLLAYQEGLFYIQDISSMLVAERAPVRRGSRVLDVCAAPGGKSLHIAEMLARMDRSAELLNPQMNTLSSAADEDRACGQKMGNSKSRGRGVSGSRGMVLARDLTEGKVARIRENIARSRMDNIFAQVFDARTDDDASHEAYDIVLADLPCSGLGVIGKKPEIRYRLRPEDLTSLAGMQRQILAVVKNYVKAQGSLVYSTCTISRQENEENVEHFLAENADFHLISQEQILPEPSGRDGFFIAVFSRN